MLTAYKSIHQRLRRLRGPAVEHPCVQCGGPAKDWAYDHRDDRQRRKIDPVTGFIYSDDLSSYLPMCVACHRAFDLVNRPTACPHGHPYAGHNLLLSGPRQTYRLCRTCKLQRLANYRRSRMQDPEFRERQKEYNRLYQQRQRAAKAAS